MKQCNLIKIFYTNNIHFADYFDNDKKLLMKLIVVGIMAMLALNTPLFLMNYFDVGLDNSIYSMLFVETSLSALMYTLVLKGRKAFNMRISQNKKTLIILFCVFVGAFILKTMPYDFFNKNGPTDAIELTPQLVITLMLIVPFYEEIIFRGCLFGVFCFLFKKNILAAMIMTSIVFAVSHASFLNIGDQIELFLTGMLLNHARVLSKGFFYPISLHSFANLLFLYVNF